MRDHNSLKINKNPDSKTNKLIENQETSILHVYLTKSFLKIYSKFYEQVICYKIYAKFKTLFS